jgi:uncharacterized protein with von Willebrand factor type A (vWA) domain
VIAGLQRFFDEIRRAGVRVSPAECVEAVRAVEQVGFEDRERFRQALRATLVKRAMQRKSFDEVFDRFFVGPARAGDRKRGRPGAGAADGARTKTRSVGVGPPQAAPSTTPTSPPDRPSRESAKGKSTELVERRRPEGRRAEHDASERLERRLREVREGRRQRWGRLRHVSVSRIESEARPELDQRVKPVLSDLRRPAGAEQEREIARAVRRLVERIRLRTGRRMRRTRTGRPYLRRVFRDSLRSGGVPFRLPHRKPRLRTPRVVLLVDVSWSTARAAGLFLEMAGEFLRLGRQTRVILFVDRPVDATEKIALWLERGRDRSFRELLGSIEGLSLEAPSDYGRVFHSLLVSPRRPRGRRTVLLVLGDGRTNLFDPLDWALEEIAGGCGASLWLVPEPFVSWGRGDSALPLYLPRVEAVVEAGDLNGLARGVAALVRRL